LLDPELGTLEEGLRADWLLLEAEHGDVETLLDGVFEVVQVGIAGQVVYERP
jgi:hypothetical protein